LQTGATFPFLNPSMCENDFIKMRKVAFLFLLISLISNGLIGQTNWLKHYGGGGNDEIMDVCKDQTGNIYFTGYFSNQLSISGQTVQSFGNEDVVVGKLDVNGNLIWIVGGGGTGADQANSISLDSEGNIYIGGFFHGPAQFGNQQFSSGEQDYFISKLSSSGQFIWTHTGGGSDFDQVSSIAVDLNGNIFATGNFKGSAQIGGNNFTSGIHPTTGLSTYDFFLLKLSAVGAGIWSIQGKGEYDDNGLDLGLDQLGNVYLSAQFSDTLMLGANQINNSVFNCGLIVKFTNNGNQSWVRKLSGSYCRPSCIQVKNTNEIILAGDFMGNLGWFSSPPTFSNNPYLYKYFVANMNGNGMLNWISNGGSDNEVNMRGMDIDEDGSIYLGATFKCTMTEFNESHGPTTFKSVGFKDILAIKYNQAGNRVWERNFGSAREDWLGGIIVNIPDKPIVLGSFSEVIHVPVSNSTPPDLAFNITQNQIPFGTSGFVNCFWSNPLGFSYSNCLDRGKFLHSLSNGLKDWFICSPIDTSIYHYDYFNHSSCDYLSVEDRIGGNGNQINDTIHSCGFNSHIAYYLNVFGKDVNCNQAFPAFSIGPEYNFLWNTGEDNWVKYNPNEGWNWCVANSEDGCFQFTDSVYVDIDTFSNILADNRGQFHSSQVNYEVVSICPAEQLILWPTELLPGDSLVWFLNGSPYFFGDTLYVSQIGKYDVKKISLNGCSSTVRFRICLDILGDQIGTEDLSMNFFDSDNNLLLNDTIEACFNDSIIIHLVDSTDYALLGDSIPCKKVTWSLNDEELGIYSLPYYGDIVSTWDFHKVILRPHHSGPQIVRAKLLNTCGGDYQELTISRAFYQSTPNFPIPSFGGIHSFCSGDSLEVIAIGSGGTFNWEYTNPALPIQSTNDSIFVSLPGILRLTETIHYPNGCVVSHINDTLISYYETPFIHSNPSHGFICPFDSIQLWVDSALTYEWIGPNSAVLSQSRTIYVSTPGLYYCNITNLDGCVLNTNAFEVKGYNSPYIWAYPSTQLCPNGSIQLQVVANESSILVWTNPNNNSQSLITIDQAGTFSCQATFCGITETASITINPPPPSPSLHLTGNDTICPLDTIQLEVIGNYLDYSWSHGFPNSIVQVSDSGQYWCKVFDQNGCTMFTDTLTIAYKPYPPTPSVVSDTTICWNSSLLLEVQNPAQFIFWYDRFPPSSPIGNLANLQIDNIQTDTLIFVTQSNGICSSDISSIQISIVPQSDSLSVTGDLTLCPGQTLNLALPGLEGLIANWSFQNAVISDSLSLNLPNPSPGLYGVEYQMENCAIFQNQLVVYIDTTAPPVILMSEPAPFCQNDVVSLQISNGSDSIVWSNGVIADSINVFSNGLYFASKTSPSGCILFSDTIELHFRPIPDVPNILDTIICHSGVFSMPSLIDSLNFSWNFPSMGAQWFSGNIMEIQATGIGSQIVNFVTSDGICESSMDSFSITFAPGSVIEWLNRDTTACPDDTIFLQIQDQPNVQFTWLWQGETLSNTSILNFQPATSDTIQFLIDNHICPIDTTEIFIQVYETHTFQIQPFPLPNQAVCQGDTLTLSVVNSNVNSLVWYPGQIMTDFLLINSGGQYFAQAIDSQGCQVVSDTIQLAFSPLPLLPNFTDSSFCPGADLEFSISVYENSLWYVNGVVSSIGSLQLNNFEDSITVSVRVTDSLGCQNTSNAWNLFPIHFPQIEAFSFPELICKYRPFEIGHSGSSAPNSFWINPTGDTLSGLEPISMISNTSNDGIYQLYTVIENCWNLSDTIHIIMHPTPHIPETNPPYTFCSNVPTYLSDESSYSEQNQWIDWNGNHFMGDSINLGIVGEEGDFDVVVFRDSLGCLSDTLVRTIHIKPSPDYVLLSDTTICENIGFQIEISHPGWNVFWQDSIEQNIFFVNDTGLLILRIENQYHCELIDSVRIYSYDCNPDSTNVFTPNGDGINDFFEFTQNGITCEEVHIYNRYGIEVASWNESWGIWDGTLESNGSPAEAGLYFYTAHFCRADGYTYDLTGFIQLIR
jgi:gliding motility-associated-like protein